MGRYFLVCVLICLSITPLFSQNKKIRLADVGWTDITATTAITAELLRTRGYHPEVRTLSVPVTFRSLQTGDMDVFLGNWMPTQSNDILPYLQSKSVRKVAVNLTGAKYTLAVPQYVYDTGVTSAEHLANHADRFHHKIYGIEAGNDGNRLILEMIQNNTYRLRGWTLVESSEQAMLMEAKRAIDQQQWIIFLGWQPHPMNTKMKMAYLEDPLEIWGPGGGLSEVHTILSASFLEKHPELLPFFENLTFTVEMENEWMRQLLEEEKKPEVMAQEWLKAHPEQQEEWCRYLPRLQTTVNSKPPPEEPFPFLFHLSKIPLGKWIESGIQQFTNQFTGQSRWISEPLRILIEGMIQLLFYTPPWLLIGILGGLAYLRNRSIFRAVAIMLSFTLIWNLGYWEATLQTLALIAVASGIALLIGIPIGIWCARHPFIYRGVRLLLDLMQTIPTFVYLIPTLMLFGLGVVPGLISTIIFAIPAPIRLTHLGIHSVPKDLMEAGKSFGASPFQILWKIEIPYAMPSIMEGVSQCIMLSLSMVVIATLVGAEGLGTDVIRALNTVNIAQGFEAGLSIVIVAICFDRLLKKKNPFGNQK